MPQLVFITLFLGLISGTNVVELRSTPDVKAVSIRVDGREVAVLKQPPWLLGMNFGDELEPRQLVAIGYDAQGNEIARTSQFVDLPRPLAEVAIVLEHDQNVPVAVTLVGTHLKFAAPGKAVITVDGRKLPVRALKARLPHLDWSHPHVVDATLRFEDGTVARRELVLEGGFSDATGTEVTPIAVTRTSGAQNQSLDGCFSASGVTLRTAAVEQPEALVAIVQDPDPTEALTVIEPIRRLLAGPADRHLFRQETQLQDRTMAKIMWPIPQTFSQSGQPPSLLFEKSMEVDVHRQELVHLLTSPLVPLPPAMQPRQFADAVAVAGVHAITEPRRRAVILVLSTTPDGGVHSPAAARHYLQSIGVPLFVWSLHGPRPDLADSWGEVDDVSSRRGLRLAIDRVRQTLAKQSIVWLATDPLTALRAEAKESCGVTTVARLGK